MERAMYFRRQAEALLGLSRATIDLGVARRLRTLAAEFQAKAEEIADEAADPAQVTPGLPERRSRPALTRVAPAEPIPRTEFVLPEEMRRGVAMTTAEEAFSRAAMCADQAQTARDEETRTFFNRLRDSWVRVANNYQIAESLAADVAPPRQAGHQAGMSADGAAALAQPDQ